MRRNDAPAVALGAIISVPILISKWRHGVSEVTVADGRIARGGRVMVEGELCEDA